MKVKVTRVAPGLSTHDRGRLFKGLLIESLRYIQASNKKNDSNIAQETKDLLI